MALTDNKADKDRTWPGTYKRRDAQSEHEQKQHQHCIYPGADSSVFVAAFQSEKGNQAGRTRQLFVDGHILQHYYSRITIVLPLLSSRCCRLSFTLLSLVPCLSVCCCSLPDDGWSELLKKPSIHHSSVGLYQHHQTTMSMSTSTLRSKRSVCQLAGGSTLR